MNKIRLAVTDSGLGGLSILAEIYEILKRSDKTYSAELIFVNALPETGQGYNKMSGEDQKIRVFNNVLYGIEKHFRPDLIAIACNTLSVLLEKTAFYGKHKKPVISIVENSIEKFIREFSLESTDKIIIYGTETTIESGLHKKILIQKGIKRHNITEQSCPDLASEIEKDYKSHCTRSIIEEAVKTATTQIQGTKDKIFIFLACTHYGFVKDQFLKAHNQAGFSNCEIINPNHSMSKQVVDYVQKFDGIQDKHLSVKVYSRCEILPEEIDSISRLLGDFSMDTIESLKKYVLRRDLF